MKQLNNINKLKIVLLNFSIATLVSHASFASILNMERNNPGIKTKPLTNIENQKLTNPRFNFYNSFESQFNKDYEFIFFYSVKLVFNVGAF